MILQVNEGESALHRGDQSVQTLDLVMVIHLNGAIDMPAKSTVVERLIGEIKKQFSSVRDLRKSLVLDDLVLHQDGHDATRAGRPLELAPMEYSLLEYLMLHSDRVVREQTLMEEVIGSKTKTKGYNTLWVHMHRLRKKLDAGQAPKLLFTIRGVGYVLRTPAVISKQAS